ncbi:MAG: class I SAM-dependent methyltransferase [Myxococcota bacterium]
MELLFRHPEVWSGDAVVIGSARLDAPELEGAARFSTDERARGHAAVGVTYEGRHDVAVVLLPKGKRRRDYFFALARAAAPTLIVVGAKNEGIKSARKVLATQGAVRRVEYGNHQQLVVAALEQAPISSLATWELRYEARDLTVVSLPGVFSDGRLDAGTTCLLDALPPLQGRVLDLGCGTGILGAFAAAQGAEVVLADVDHLAVESAARTLRANGLAGKTIASDLFANVAGRFDAIVTNPPFHQGVQTEYDVTRRLIRDAAAHLTPEGTLWIVANRFLPWEEPLRARFAEVRIASENSRFRIYAASQPND